jgi:hypothetical protein
LNLLSEHPEAIAKLMKWQALKSGLWTETCHSFPRKIYIATQMKAMFFDWMMRNGGYSRNVVMLDTPEKIMSLSGDLIFLAPGWEVMKIEFFEVLQRRVSQARLETHVLHSWDVTCQQLLDIQQGYLRDSDTAIEST